MRVLHIVSSLNPAAGGVSQAIITMIEGLNKEGIRSEVATIDDPDSIYLQDINITVYALGPGKTAWQYAPALLKWLTKNIQQYNAVFVHGLWQYQTYATYKAWKRIKEQKPKLLVMPHGMLDPYFQRAKGRKLKAIRNWLFWKWNERKLINNANALLFTCETEKLLAREPFKPYCPKQESVVGLGVEAPPDYTPDMQIAFTEKVGISLPNYWLFISRIHPKKGVDLLVDAYLKLKKEIPSIPPLVIAGPGLDTPFGKEMLLLAAADKEIYFPDMLTGAAKWGAFYGCEAFILPSHQENFGIAVVEALACGKPVLISNQVNIWREIVEGKGGIASQDTKEATQNLLKEWISYTKVEKEAIVSNSKNVYFDNYSVKHTSENIIQLLQ